MRRALADVWGLMAGLRGFGRTFWLSVAAMFAAQMLLVLLTAVSVRISSLVVAREIMPGAAIWPITVIIVMAIGQGVAFLLECWWSHELAYKVLASLRVDIFAALRRIAPRGLQGRRTADVAARSMSDVEQLEWFYAHTVATAVNAIITSIVIVSITTWYMGPLALWIIPTLVAMVAIPLSFVRWQRRQGERMRERLSELKVTALDALQGMRELHVLQLTDRYRTQLASAGIAVQRAQRASNLRKILESGIGAWLLAALHLGVLAVLTARVRAGDFPPLALPVSVTLVSLSAVPVVGLVGMFGRIGEIGACAARVNELLDAPDAVPPNPLPPAELPSGSQVAGDLDGTLTARSVDFQYEPNGAKVLSDVSLRIKRGQTVALFGPSGVGKSTFAFLALRFLDPTGGALTFSGADLRTVTPDAHRERVTLLPQSSYIFAGTIRDNLAIAAPAASEVQLWEALRLAGVETLVENLGGLDAIVGDRGTTLSGGERQRLGLARVFLRDYQVLILDEPLANVDPKLEAEIIAALTKHRAGKSTLIIAHRIASIRHADHIVVLQDGRVADAGTHAELALRCPQYQRAVSAQRGS